MVHSPVLTEVGIRMH